MAINPTGAVAVPLTVFGSWVSEVAPNAVPENISPDCSDVMFAPGSTGSRPALRRVYSTPFPAGGSSSFVPSTVYAKSFVTSTGDIKNLTMDSNGVLYVEDVTNNPGVYTVLFTSTPGSYCRSCTAFGREYLAISDGLHGQEVPLQYDGTYLDRVTQNGPAVAPVVNSLSLPSVTMVVTTPRNDNVASIVTTGKFRQYNPVDDTYYAYSTITVTLTAPDTSLAVGQSLTITGNSQSYFNNVPAQIQSITSSTVFVCAFYSSSYLTGTGGSFSVPGVTIQRGNNIVSVTTATAHGLQIGYQAQITGVTASVIGTSISSIVVNNENLPGLATVNTSTAHGLSPGEDVTITGVTAVAVGGGISSAVRNSGSVTISTASAHGVIPGAVIVIAGVTDTSFDGTYTVASVPNPTQICFYVSSTTNSTSSGGTASIAWPIPDNTPTPTYFTVVTCPTATSFQVQVTTGDNTWTTGTVSFAWNGIYYVVGVQSSTSFTYQNYGPNATSTSLGTVTPYGQCAPGIHLMQVLYLTRQGAITAPSQSVSFVSNGGQYVSVNNIPIGPSNVVARILAFTGSQPNVPGELPPFFYLPVPAQLEGQTVSTATQIDDNTTTSVLLDFSDNSLYAGLGISTPGNMLANQIVLDGALGFGKYSSRLVTWGQRNYVQNLLNMGFDADTTGITYPQGWTVATGGGTTISLTSRPAGAQWKITCPSTTGNFGEISQSLYLDTYGDPIALANQYYSMRVWLASSVSSGASFVATISSASTSFSTSVSVLASAMSSTGGWFTLNFPTIMPVTIPQDLQLTITGAASTVATVITVDEMGLYPTENPYTDGIGYASYVNNPEGMDGLTGKFGPVEDENKFIDVGIIRETLYILTQDPSGRIHETTGSGTSEPSGWPVNEVAANCGTLSAFGVTHSQADDEAGSGGDNWMAWPSEGGVLLFGGGLPEKITQEIQPNWNDPGRSGFTQINMSAALSIWGFNDPVQRLLMFGVPTGTATAPNKIYVLNYRNLNSANAIMASPPFHPSFAGKLIATDNSRKWAPWNISANSAARVYRTPGQLSLVLCGGNGKAPGTAASYGNLYTLLPNSATDDDYGAFASYYTTYFFLDPEKAQALQLNGRFLLAFWQMYVAGTGTLTVTPLIDELSNAWSLSVSRALVASPKFDLEGGGGYATGNRIALKISGAAGTVWTLSRLIAYFKSAKMKIRGAAL